MTKLIIDLIPSSCFYSNVRTNVQKKTWDKIRKKVYKKANYKCEICNGVGKKHPVECHEIWEYKKGKQILKGFIALCPSCHEVKHFGLAQHRGFEERAKKHLMKINKWNEKETEKHIINAFNTWNKRSLQEWELDISFLEKFYGTL